MNFGKEGGKEGGRDVNFSLSDGPLARVCLNECEQRTSPSWRGIRTVGDSQAHNLKWAQPPVNGILISSTHS